MASKPPPIIRSSKPFSVEIPEGSKSAKSRRSDVVPGEELEIHHKASDYHELAIESPDSFAFANPDDADRLASVADSTDAQHRLHQESHSQTANLQSVNETKPSNKTNAPTVGTSAPAARLAKLPPSANASRDNIQALDEDSLNDRHAQEPKTGAIKDRLAQENHNGPIADKLAPENKNNVIKDRLVGQAQNPLKDNLQAVAEDGISSIDTGFHAADNLQDTDVKVAKEAIKDRLVGDNTPKQDKRNAAVAAEPAKSSNTVPLPTADQESNTQTVEQEQLSDNVQPVHSAGLADNKQALDNDPLTDNLQPVATDPLVDNLQPVASDSLADNLQPLPSESLPNNTQGLTNKGSQSQVPPLANQALKDRKASEDAQALSDNVQPLPDTASADHRAPLEDEALEDNVAQLPVEPHTPNTDVGIAKEALSDEAAAIPAQGVATRDDAVEKTHVQDHVVALPDTHQPLKDGPSPVLAGSYAASGHPTPVAAAHAAASHVADHHPLAAPTHPAGLSKAEQAKRAEAFHSRVQAIRKSVSGINHLLDDLQDKS